MAAVDAEVSEADVVATEAAAEASEAAEEVVTVAGEASVAAGAEEAAQTEGATGIGLGYIKSEVMTVELLGLMSWFCWARLAEAAWAG